MHHTEIQALTEDLPVVGVGMGDLRQIFRVVGGWGLVRQRVRDDVEHHRPKRRVQVRYDEPGVADACLGGITPGGPDGGLVDVDPEDGDVGSSGGDRQTNAADTCPKVQDSGVLGSMFHRTSNDLDDGVKGWEASEWALKA